ncbi:MAG: ROK family protein [Acidobacteriales bacterium]|nr:ROK family protein [Terriglobales bacterium]
MAYFSIGVDLGGTNLRIAAVDEQGAVLDTISTDTAVARGRDMVISEMCDAILTLRDKCQKRATLVGVGIGVPGIIDMHTGMLRESPNLPGWGDYPVREEIERRLHTRIVLENDANAAALGEFWMGAARDVNSMCMYTLGTGVGGGIVLDGHIWHGMTGMAGELGHNTVYPDGVHCPCGNHGCVEQYASATAIRRMAREAVVEKDASTLSRALQADPHLSAQEIFQLAKNGDAASQQVFEKAGEALGIAVAAFVNALNLPMYVIGGGVSAAWDAFAPKMMETIRARSFVYKATNPESQPLQQGKSTIVTRALLGSDAGLLGAARLPMVEQEQDGR